MKHKDFLKYEEKCKHGTNLFPFVIYPINIPEYVKIFPVHWHEECELVYVESGSCTYCIDFVQYQVKKGDLILIPPEKLHSYEQQNVNKFEARVLVFHMNFIQNNVLDVCSTKYFMPFINGEISLPIHINKMHPLNISIASCLSEIFELYDGKKAAYELGIKELLLRIFYIFFSNQEYITKTNRLESAAKSSNQVKMIIQYIENHYQEKITLNDLSECAHLSVYHLVHTFKKCTGLSPIQYVNHYRLSIAANMLVTASLPVIDISNEIGFCNVSYFNREFKKKFGKTPLSYRKSNKI